VAQVFKATKGNDLGAFGLGLMLLFPRVINGLAGHMAYAGIFGYFIGLAVIRPRKAPLLLLIGWLTAAILHALWNSTGTISEYINYLVAAGTVVVLIACLLKARQIEASIFGRSVETSGSIIVGAPGSGSVYGMAPPPVPPPVAPQQQWGGGAPQPRQQWGNPAPQQAAWGAPAPQGPQPQWGGPAPAYPGGAPVAPPAAPPGGYQQPYPYPASGPEAATTPMQPTTPAGSALMLAVAGVNVPLRAGAIIDLSTIPALGERGRGLVGEVSVHPRNPGVIGLKNLGTATWYARLRDGSVQPVEPQRNVRLAGGINLDFGGGVQGVIVG
ncbi:MAG: PrsW family glutamic-type intramembrane protease, partial [Acetobacteraceae bacterium]